MLTFLLAAMGINGILHTFIETSGGNDLIFGSDAGSDDPNLNDTTFFGDFIDSIRWFDVDTQRSEEAIEAIRAGSPVSAISRGSSAAARRRATASRGGP